MAGIDAEQGGHRPGTVPCRRGRGRFAILAPIHTAVRELDWAATQMFRPLG
jgi:hypothetical protein